MEHKPLYYSVWLVVDRKIYASVLILAALAVMFCVFQSSGWLAAFVAAALLFLTVWYIFVPVKFEINSNGIVRTVFGRQWFVSWSDIKGYQIRYYGLLLLPQNDRFLLESFNGFYLPVPKDLMPEVLYRFRIFIGE